MAEITTTKPDASEAPATPCVVLALARTRTERSLIDQWAAKEHPGAAVTDAATDLADRPDNENPLVVPARIAWLPPRGVDAGYIRLGTVLAHVGPRRPRAFVQRVIARHRPERSRVVAGTPAVLHELRDRFDAEVSGEVAAFAAFIERAATVACDRAERQLIGDRYKVPRQVAEQITASARFRSRILELAATLQKPADEILVAVTKCLTELAAVQSPLAIDAFRSALAPLHVSAWDVHVDTASLQRLRELNRSQALVFLPAHRSYVDPLVLAEVLHAHDFPRNHLLGGNNMSFWPIGPLGKRAGVVFIRRSNSGDPVYKLALREYFGHLVAKRFNLEWYIEGGRSRTGKLRPPKIGLLAYLTRALTDGHAEDVQLVPVSIVYDQMHEVEALAAEQVGVSKGAEGLGWLARYLRGQIRNEGNAQVRFGEPFSLRAALDEAGEGPAQLDKVAFRICDGINKTTPVTSRALVTLALLGTGEHALTLDDVARVTDPLLDYLGRRHIPGPGDDLHNRAGLRAGLDRLVQAGVARRYDGGTEPVWSMTAGQHRVAAFYRNGALHHFVTRAIVELALLRIGSGAGVQDPVQAVWAEALRLRGLLEFEFFFPAKPEFRDEVVVELEVLGPRWRTQVTRCSGATGLLASAQLLVAHRTLRSFFDAQLVVASRLVDEAANQQIEQRDFLDRCVGVGQQMLLQGRLHGADSVSRELYATALQLAEHRRLVGQLNGGTQRAREDFLAEVGDVCSRLEHIEELENDLLMGASR